MCSHYHSVVSEHFHHSKKKLFLICSHSFLPETATNLLFVSIDLPLLYVSYKWNDTIHGLLCLASLLNMMILNFTQVVACLSTSFFFFYCQVESHCATFCFCVHNWWTFGLFLLFFTIMNNADINHYVQIFVWTFSFISLG